MFIMESINNDGLLSLVTGYGVFSTLFDAVSTQKLSSMG